MLFNQVDDDQDAQDAQDALLSSQAHRPPAPAAGEGANEGEGRLMARPELQNVTDLTLKHCQRHNGPRVLSP